MNVSELPLFHKSLDPAEPAREKLLWAAFDEIYRHGYQGMRIDTVLENAGLTKGALYHYFANKRELAYAVIDEVVRVYMKQAWEEKIFSSDDVITELQNVLSELISLCPEVLSLGCPLNNLAQEMSGNDEGFSERLTALYTEWAKALVEALQLGVRSGTVRSDVDADSVALFLVSAYEGIIGVSKCLQSEQAIRAAISVLNSYLDSLRA